MSNEFWIHLKLGVDHILDPNGIDHMLFIIALCAIYKLTDLKKIAILVTAFTLGHSVTLLLSSLDIVKVNATLIEILIPVTIILTALYNIVFYQKSKSSKKVSYNYALALGFGLIHGMGFSNFFRAIMMAEDNILWPLFAFNVGIEVGQLIIVAVLMIILLLTSKVFKLKHKFWNYGLSTICGLVALYLLIGVITES